MKLYFDDQNIVRFASTQRVITNLYKHVEVNELITNPVGKRIIFNKGQQPGRMKVALICNWDDACGIATYTKYLVDALGPKVEAIKIFSEKTDVEKVSDGYDVLQCWKRGEPLRDMVNKVLEWEPTVVLIQHEYGIFPKTSYILQMLQMLHHTPYVVTMHSVYEHLDKTVASSAMKNIIVHSETGKECLTRLGNKARTWVVPHGCVQSSDTGELWNTWKTPYPIMQFGFGFDYKGVDTAIEALSLLKKQHGSKYQEVFYTYFCSESPHVRNVIDEYVRKIGRKIESLGLEDNTAIVRGFQSDQILNNSLRTNRLAIFPYKTDPRNVVYGASGAIRVAIASGVPVIASSSHMFDDVEGVLPRPANAEQLAEAIDHVFSNGKYRQGLLERSATYIRDNSWDVTADRYLSVLQAVRENHGDDVIFV